MTPKIAVLIVVLLVCIALYQRWCFYQEFKRKHERLTAHIEAQIKRGARATEHRIKL